MSEELFEIAFSGQIADGADLQTVKQRIGQIFKADGTRLEQMFSGRRVVIKREADAATVAKFRGAFEKAGAVCEIRSLSAEAQVAAQAEPAAAAAPAPAEAAPAAAAPAAAAAAEQGEDYVSRYPESEKIPEALVRPEGLVEGDQIEDLNADIAPVGAQMLDQIEDVPEPQIDISGIDVAPVGSELSTTPEEEPPPPPDTSGITLAEAE
ncbi:MAG: hypothetical protein QNJ69_06840 [Gammaproteobacteria bacterium]|nr:hypothetical protein [Gammaproteobacteria bacterium]